MNKIVERVREVNESLLSSLQQRPGARALLLLVPLGLWSLALLFLLRIVNIFDRYLMKFPGPVVIFGAMVIGPLLAVVIGRRMLRNRQKRAEASVYIALGGILLIAFTGVIGAPMIKGALTPGPPKNPSTPRPVEPQVGIPVFPGAEGFGTHTIAGRGGKLIEVTSLEDSGPGSLRAALSESVPRTIVFRVGGTITLKQELHINHPYVTIAGQTAPGSGITIKNAGIVISTHDVLIQHMRVRPGNEGDVDADVNDAISILGAHGDIKDGAYNVVLDHISASWGEDETISTWYGAHDITISWSIISEALNRSRHRKETHSAGLLIGDSSYHVSMHHNLLAHNDFRNPLIADGGTHDFINNVIYNWGVLPAEIVDTDSNTFVNLIGNLFIPGPSTQVGPFEILFAGGNPQLYVFGNLGPHRQDSSIDEWALVGFGYGEGGIAPESYRSFSKFSSPSINVQDAEEAQRMVLAFAGATAPYRDSVDLRVINDVQNRSGAIIDSPEDVGGYPQSESGIAAPDSDHDGMPDDWEIEMNLDPNDASDGTEDFDLDGYTNLEEYLHYLASGNR